MKTDLKAFLDSNVVIYALGAPNPEQPASQALLRATQVGRLEPAASSELVQEVVFHRMRVGPREAAVATGRALMNSFAVHPLDGNILRRSLDLISTTDIRGRDAIHAATALENGFTEIITADPDFESIPGLRTITPTDYLAEHPELVPE